MDRQTIKWLVFDGKAENYPAWSTKFTAYRADPVLGKLGACLRYKISDILELLMRCSFTVKL